MFDQRSGQNLIEYIILLTLVIGVLLILLGPSGYFTRSVDEALNAAFNGMETEARRY